MAARKPRARTRADTPLAPRDTAPAGSGNGNETMPQPPRGRLPTDLRLATRLQVRVVQLTRELMSTIKRPDDEQSAERREQIARRLLAAYWELADESYGVDEQRLWFDHSFQVLASGLPDDPELVRAAAPRIAEHLRGVTGRRPNDDDVFEVLLAYIRKPPRGRPRKGETSRHEALAKVLTQQGLELKGTSLSASLARARRHLKT